ncbi:unnamed protein product [Nippostrongylus brasiliensis]|uniref:tRNA (uracil(54)-C(5))-methyltransferase n=1 Tax=Nippostrongylus brasiliensis TaxID=27835 RepID=A0A0N4XED1_NIPBR|nr:unnamed protein product [Nippostrongylus brasiliensis]
MECEKSVGDQMELNDVSKDKVEVVMDTNSLEASTEPNSESPNENVDADVSGLDMDRIHISNVPKYFGFKQFKKLLEKTLKGIPIGKVRQMKFDAYVSFKSPEDAQLAISKLDGLEVKKTILKAQLAVTQEKKIVPMTTQPLKPKNARESVTKLADVPYDEQLSQKTKTSINALQAHKLLRELCIGFVGGRFAQNEHHVIPIDDVDNITPMTKQIVVAVTDFVRTSGLPPFDEFARVGVWKMLTVREFGGDVMLIVSVNPLETPSKEEELKKQFCSRFLNQSTLVKDGFRITSLYWHSIANSSDIVDYEHIGGAPYIYESLLGCRFRVSPSSFFQTNSHAAAVLYTTIELLQNASICPTLQNDTGNGAEQRGTVLLDICCGTGTIGQCILQEFKNENKARAWSLLAILLTFTCHISKVSCVGVDLIPAAIVDARENAKCNGMRDNICYVQEKTFVFRCYYVAGKAEDVLPSLRFTLPAGFDLLNSNIVGVLDPPRCGVHDKVVLACRVMERLQRLVFVSCDPAAAMKNIVDLCRPSSKKYAGRAFSLVSIQPVDMFPQTPHIEWGIHNMFDTQGKVIKCKAAVAWEAKKPLSVEEIEVAPPQAHEVRVKADSQSCWGTKVPELWKVLVKGSLIFKLCKQCEYCLNPKTNLCQKIRITQGNGVMPNGTGRFTCQGKPLYHFMGCSTFSEYTVVADISLCKVGFVV